MSNYIYNHINDNYYDDRDNDYEYHGNDGVDDDDRAVNYDDCYGD